MNWRTRCTKYSPTCPLVFTSWMTYRTVLTTGRDENTSCPVGTECTITLRQCSIFLVDILFRSTKTSPSPQSRFGKVWVSLSYPVMGSIEKCIKFMRVVYDRPTVSSSFSRPCRFVSLKRIIEFHCLWISTSLQKSEMFLFDPYKKYIQSNNETILDQGTPIKTSLVANIRAAYYNFFSISQAKNT